MSVFALRAGLLRVVQLSLLGSVLSNLLLVLGTAFLVGGTRYRQADRVGRHWGPPAPSSRLAPACLVGSAPRSSNPSRTRTKSF